MKLKKLLALLLSCLMIVSLMVGCGGSDEEYEEDAEYEEEYDEEYEDEGEYEEEAPEDGAAPVSDETWEAVTANSQEFAKYSNALKEMNPEDAPEDLIAYVEEINPRVMEVAALVRESATEEECLAANEDILSWIDTLSQYIEVE